MIAAHRPVQRPPDARLLVVDRCVRITHAPRSRLVDFLRPGDLAIANDAATLPASLHGLHVPSGADVEVRLAGWSPVPLVLGCSPGPVDVALLAGAIGPAPRDGNSRRGDIHAFTAVVFGPGDFHTRTEDRPLPPPLVPGDRLVFGSATDGNRGAGHGDRPPVAGDVAGRLGATIEALLDHPRLVHLRFDGSAHAVWAGLARHGRPIQYAHVTTALAMWDVWTPIAVAPAAFESPSAGFALDWRSIRVMRERGIGFATADAGRGPLVDRRSGARSAAPVRRAISHPGRHGSGDCPRPGGR